LNSTAGTTIGRIIRTGPG